MHDVLVTLHVLAAVFVVGPLIGAAMMAPGRLRKGDAGGLRTAARLVRLYGWLSLVVVLLGAAAARSFGPLWIWLSTLLYVAALGVIVAAAVPTLDRAARRLAAGEAAEELQARVGALVGTVALLFAAIVVLMVRRPGG
jgi:uncharacterized membrane protein